MNFRSPILVVVAALAICAGVSSHVAEAQTVPPSCDGVNYDCQALQITPYAYRRIETCGNKPWKASEAIIFADELAAWGGTCNLTTERVGWYTSSTPVGGCGVSTNLPHHAYNIEIRNASKYIFRYNSPNCNSPQTERDVNVAWREREVNCPGNWGYYTTDGIPRCRRQSIRVDPDKSLGKPRCNNCQSVAGNPINTAIANKFQEETDYQSPGIGGLVFKRYYNSGMNWGNSKTSYSVGTQWDSASLGYGAYVKLAFHEEANQTRLIALDSIGAQWRHFYQRSIYLNTTPSFISAIAYRHDGRVVVFNLNGSSYVPAGDINDKLVVLGDGRYEFTDAVDETVETYLATGQLETIKHKSGMLHTVSYDSCMRIATVTDQFGHSLQFNYQHTCSDQNKEYRIVSVTLPGGATIGYAYNTSNGTLTTVTYPDLTTRIYTYGWDNGRRLTDITDESGVVFASWTYNSVGRPITSQHAGGAGAVTVGWSGGVGNWAPGKATITDSLGAVTSHNFTAKRGLNLLTSIVRPAPSGTGTTDEVWTYDANGNVATYSNHRNYRTDYVFDLTRNLETSRTEGLNNNGTTTPETRTITTQWHPTFRLPALITEPGRTTGYTYDASGNVLTKTVTDTATSVSRTWTWTYDTYGRLLTADGPRTDVADVTTYTYYSCSTGFQCGQIQTITNAVGHVTTFSTYNAHGQALTILDLNNVLITLTYDGRQRLTSRTVDSEMTGFTYWPTGLLKRVTLPDASYLEYTYDNAHRLTQVADADGNRIVYTLDTMGNRTAENAYDPSSALTRTRTRVYNNLNRLYQELGALSQTTQYVYDNNGNNTSVTDPLLRTTSQVFDPLDRLKQIVDPLLGQTSLAYDGRDDLTSVTDPRGLVTTYTRNGFGDVTQQVSPDTGTTINTYDSGGNLKTSNDARNKTGTYSYDALNRVTSLAYNDQTITYTYDTGTNGNGRLTQLASTGATMSYSYDSNGRVLTKTQLSNGNTKTISYQYNSAGQLSQMTTPSNKVIVYGYTNGKVSNITVNGVTLLSNVVYEPFGPVGGWTWGNSTLAVRTYDLDGRVGQIDSGDLRTYGWDAASRITSILDAQNSSLDQSYDYDNLDRLTSVTKANGNQAFTYDANGNRLTYDDGAASSAYVVAGTSNRLTSITGSQARTYGYNAVGAVTSYGSITLAYSDRERIKSATAPGGTWNYYLNGLGERVRKSLAAGGNHYYVYDEAGHLVGEYSGNTLIQETVWLGDIPVATLRGSSIYYVHTDHLNAPRLVTQPSDNAIRWRWDRDPFGAISVNENPSGLGAFSYNLRLPGQFYDSETGLNYNYFRDYDPGIGRYVESDPIGLRGGVNTYSYVLANPLSYLDPLGLEVFVCSRKAKGAFAPFNANHGYLWDSRSGKTCGANGSSGFKMENPLEVGPTGDECNLVWNSNGKEDQIMKCCSESGKEGWFPFTNDCQAREGACIEQAGLKDPGAPGGRFGPATDAPGPIKRILDRIANPQLMFGGL